MKMTHLTRPHSALNISNYFIQKSFEQGDLIDAMKLVKLVYVAHGWHLGLTGKPLISEIVESWKYGPIIPSVYRGFKRYGIQKITSMHPSHLIFDFSEALVKFLDKVWDEYLPFNNIQISTLTNQPETPWGKVQVGEVIPNNVIRLYYESRLD